MPESDVSKMKVADLKRELKLRGLSITGNKNELQDRLQIALIDGDETLDDSTLAEEELLGDEDAVLTDEDEEKILNSDENELLHSPKGSVTTEHTTAAATAATVNDTAAAVAAKTAAATTSAKKVVLKRQLSSTLSAVIISKENTEPSSETAKIAKTSSQHTDITADDKQSTDNGHSKITNKIAQLSMQQRLEMRAKKFGVTSSSANEDGKSTATAAAPTTTATAVESKQIEQLKKRAERFGCVTSTEVAQIDLQERLKKRQERFGVTTVTSSTKSDDNNEWAKKARLRLQRFGGVGASDAAVKAETTPTTEAAPTK